jgi:hypothetical protein
MPKVSLPVRVLPVVSVVVTGGCTGDVVAPCVYGTSDVCQWRRV